MKQAAGRLEFSMSSVPEVAAAVGSSPDGNLTGMNSFYRLLFKLKDPRFSPKANLP